jgi:SAM-dependent methyltransferase
LEIIEDSMKISPYELSRKPHARLLFLEEALEYLASPDTGYQLCWSECGTKLTDGSNQYTFREELPILMPVRLMQYYTNKLEVPSSACLDPFFQYYFLATIKQSGEINAAPMDESVQRHLFRMTKFLSGCSGTILDVGCDDPILSASLFPTSVKYIGLDPFSSCLSPFRIIGLAEHLPFADALFDSVIFNTSLDHIFDWRRALSQAKRILKKNGTLYISSYIWTDKADLMTDSVHFHHFRYYELLGALEELNFCKIDSTIYESPKGDAHRHGLYLKAHKA